MQPQNTWKRETSGELFKKWVEFAKAAGEQPGSQKAFSEALQRHGVEKRKASKGVRIFIGVQLRKPASREAA